MKYYQLIDIDVPGRWYLRGLWDSNNVELDPRECRYGRHLDLSPLLRIRSESGEMVLAQYPLTTKVKRKGRQLDFTYDTSDMPVVTKSVAEVFLQIAPTALQLIPVNVEGFRDNYYILNITKRIDAIDRRRSDLEYWIEGEIRPEKVGKPKSIYDLKIDPIVANGEHLFRASDWEIALIASETVRKAFLDNGFSGLEFLPV